MLDSDTGKRLLFQIEIISNQKQQIAISLKTR
jgi:hypothetical protein